MKKFILITAMLFSTIGHAEEPRLKELMATMGGHAQGILAGILYDDFEVIKDAVAWVGNHPEPTADLAKIKAELGVQVLRFKWYDTQAHNAAIAIGVAAQNRDMKEVSKQYGKMIVSCTNCHNAFRDRLRDVLHKDE